MLVYTVKFMGSDVRFIKPIDALMSKIEKYGKMQLIVSLGIITQKDLSKMPNDAQPKQLNHNYKLFMRIYIIYVI